VLRALGMTSRRVGRVLIWQGVSLALAITVVGLPLGLGLGSVVWRLYADQLGVIPHPVLSGLVALFVPAAIAVGIIASLVPARRARKSSIAPLLRAD
jgi:putative ABC transport system permease protein